MDAMILTLTFAAAVAVAACVVLAFSGPIDDVLRRMIPAEMLQAWSRYLKFAVFTATFVGGLRLSEVGALVVPRQGPGAPPPIGAAQGLLEVYKTLAGALGAAAWILLVFFGAALAVHAAARIYESLKSEAAPPRGSGRHSGSPAGLL